MAVEVLEAPTTWHAPAPRRRWLLRVVLLGLAGVLLGALVGAGVLAYGTSRYAEEHRGRLLPGAVIAGVDVSGLHPAEAVTAVEATFAQALDRTVTVVFGEQEWPLSAREAGVTTDAAEAVQAAAAAAGRATWRDLAALRWRQARLDFTREVSLTYPRDAAAGLAAEIAATLEQAPQDAALSYDTGWVRVTPHRVGRRVPAGELATRIQRALEGGAATVTVPLHLRHPAVRNAAFRQVLLVREADQRLYYYEDGRMVRDWRVSTGTGSYPTPGGDFVVGDKRYMPSWTNPAPNGWGADMPAYIPPGLGNPLGLRAINWDTPDGGLTAIRFHGTQAVGQLGRPASHGCVRLSNPDAIELYDLIEPGARIISVRA